MEEKKPDLNFCFITNKRSVFFNFREISFYRFEQTNKLTTRGNPGLEEGDVFRDWYIYIKSGEIIRFCCKEDVGSDLHSAFLGCELNPERMTDTISPFTGHLLEVRA